MFAQPGVGGDIGCPLARLDLDFVGDFGPGWLHDADRGHADEDETEGMPAAIADGGQPFVAEPDDPGGEEGEPGHDH